MPITKRVPDRRGLETTTSSGSFGLGSKNLDHLLVDLRGRRDAAIASAKLARDALVERIARADRHLAKAEAGRDKAEQAVVGPKGKPAGTVAKAGRDPAAARARRHGARRCAPT